MSVHPAASLDDIVSMALFARVVEARSFTAAAAALGVAKSLASSRVSRLEDRLGVRLLHRTTRRLSLTDEGVAFYERCARILQEADATALLADRASKEPRGTLRVDAPLAFAQLHLASAVDGFLRAHPQVRVELSVSDRFVDLFDAGCDVAIRITNLRDSELTARKLGDDRNVVVAAPAYLARNGAPATPHELVHHDCLHYLNLRLEDEWRFRAPGQKAPFSVPIAARFAVGTGLVLAAAAVAGAGIAVMPTFMVAKELAAGTLVTLLDGWDAGRLGIHAVHAHKRNAPAKVRAFVDFLAARFRTGKHWPG